MGSVCGFATGALVGSVTGFTISAFGDTATSLTGVGPLTDGMIITTGACGVGATIGTGLGAAVAASQDEDMIYGKPHHNR